MEKKPDRRIYSGANLEDVREDLKVLVDFRDDGLALKDLARLLDDRLIPHLMRYDQPGFLSFFNVFPERGAEFGARLALEYNQGVTNWLVSPGGAVLEELCCQALCRLFGLPQGSEGTFMYCGTYANQQALYMALHRHAERRGFNLAEKGLAGFSSPSRLAVVVSNQAHFSLRHAVRVLGLGEQSLISVPTDENHRLNVERLRDMLESLKAEHDLFCVVATAGTTSTGSVDPVRPTASICSETGAWLHVDGAYGLAYSLVPEYRRLFDGIELADSVSWDPHKQMGIPIPSSLLFVRCREDFARLAIYGQYFNRKDDPNPNPGLKSPPSTRPFSALPLVASLRHQGMKRVIERLRAPLAAVKSAAERLKNEPDIEICNDPETGILCLRIVPQGFPQGELDDLQQNLYARIKSAGRRSISITRLNDQTVLRLVAVSPEVTAKDLLDTVRCLRALSKGMS